MSKFKVGDKVICIENPDSRDGDEYNDGRGAGWKLGHKFAIQKITGVMHHPILWGGVKGCGVFEDNVELCEYQVTIK